LNEPHSEEANNDVSQAETIIPSFNQDPPITMEEALFLISGDPDKYVIGGLYIITNLLSMAGFMFALSTLFLFEEPKVECRMDDLEIYFRCSI